MENIFSFYEKTEFNMLPNPKRGRFAEHVYKDLPVRVLKQSAIYGANGAGKSNLLNVLETLRKFVCDDKHINPYSINEIRFRLIGNNKAPVNIEVEFIEGRTCFYYSVSLDIGNIREALYLSGCEKGEDRLLFERNSAGSKHSLKIFDKQGVSLNNPAVDGVVSNFFAKNPYSSTFVMLEELGVIKDRTISKAYKWFDEKLVTLGTNPKLKRPVRRMEKDKDYARFANEVISSMGIGINKVQVRSEPIEKFLERVAGPEENQKEELLKKLYETISDSVGLGSRVGEIVKENGKLVVKTLEFMQTGVDGYEGTLAFADQSNGTVQLMHLMPLLYGLVNSKSVFCIDEIENSIHPIVIKAFIKLFADNANSKGQLIFTTHECHLLNQQELMRPDEVWFAEKHNGMTKLYSLNDFKEHNTIDIEKGYLAGRYGAIPYLGTKNDL